MESYTEYWAGTMLRGILAILAGTAALFIPEVAYTTFLLPFEVVTSIVCLAAYGTIDSAIVFAMAFTIPRHRPGRLAMRMQGVLGVTIGVVLFSLVYRPVRLHWFVYLAAVQAAGAAVAEFTVAKGTSIRHGARWCYAAAVVATLSAFALLTAGKLPARELAWLIYGYLVIFGMTLLALSTRMLFAERHRLTAASAFATAAD